MRYMVDTNILIYLLKNKPPGVAERVNALAPDDTLCMSFVTYGELLLGAERSDQKSTVHKRLSALVTQVPVLYPKSASICQHYAEQFARLKSTGQLIGANDLWIAAHALAEGAVLVSNNLREFERIEGLVTENWV